MKATAAYFELENLMGLYANQITCGCPELNVDLFTADAELEINGCVMHGEEEITQYFHRQSKKNKELGIQEFFSVFGQLTEVQEDEQEAKCLWMFLSVSPDSADQLATHRIGRIDQVCVRENGRFKIRQHRQFVRTSLEPINLCGRVEVDPDACPKVDWNMFQTCDNDNEIGEMLDVLNVHSRYEQYLHCGNWDKIDHIFSQKPDVSWTVGNTRKKFLAEHPEYQRESDGPGYCDEPPYWMGAKIGHKRVIDEGFRGMVLPFSPENKGLYCCSDMLLPLVEINWKTHKAYTSAPSYGGLILGPAFGMNPPYPVLNSIGRWMIEWVKEEGQWKMLHFFWSTIYEISADFYDPIHRDDWLSTHEDIHDWPELPKPYESADS